MDGRRIVAYLPLAAILSLAALLQTVHMLRSPTVSADGITFVTIARDLPQGTVAAFRRHDQHPGYPALLLAATRAVQALGYRAEPESWMAGGILVAFTCGLLSIWVVWLMARDLFDEQVANLAACVFAVLPVPRCNAADALSDTPHVLFYLVAAWLFCRALASGRVLPLAGAGLASGIAYWIRPEGLVVAVVAAACLAWHGVRSGWGVRRVALCGAALAGTALLVVAPYWVLAGKLTSKQLPFAKAQVTELIAEIAEPQATGATASSPQVVEHRPAPATPPELATAGDLPAAFVAPSPAAVSPKRFTAARLAKTTGDAIATFLNSICQGFKFIFIPLYLVGHVELIRRKPAWAPIVFVAALAALHILVLMALFAVSGYIDYRHVLPLVALGMPFTGLGIVYVGRKLAALRGLPSAYGVLATLGISCAMVVPYAVRPFSRDVAPVIEATHWVESRAEVGAGVVCNSPYVSFYGTLPVAMLDYRRAMTLDDALATAPVDARYDYVVLHVNADNFQPQWLPQLEARYRQVREFPDPYSTGRPKKVLVFEAREGHVTRVARQPRS